MFQTRVFIYDTEFEVQLGTSRTYFFIIFTENNGE